MANNLGTTEFPFDQHRLYLAQGGGTFTESIVAPDGVFPEYPVYLNCDPRAGNTEELATALGVSAYGAKAYGIFSWTGSNNTYFLNYKRGSLSPPNAGWDTEEDYHDGWAAYDANPGYYEGIPVGEYGPPCTPTRYCCGATPNFGFYTDEFSPSPYIPGSGNPIGIPTVFNTTEYITFDAGAAAALRIDCASVNIKVETPPACTRWYATYSPFGECNETARVVSNCTSDPSCAAVNCCPGIYVDIHVLHEAGLTYTPCGYEYNFNPPENPVGWEIISTPIEIESWDNEDVHFGYTHNRVDGDNMFLLPPTGAQVNLTGACKCADTIFASLTDIPGSMSYTDWVEQYTNIHVNVYEYFHGFMVPPCTLNETNVTLRLEITQE